METPTRDDVIALLTLYRTTSYEVRLPGGGRCCLRLGHPPPQALQAWLAPVHDWVFLTAWNPYSHACPTASNRSTQRALRFSLQQTGTVFLAGVGRIPGQSWREPALLVAGLDLARIDALAGTYRQNAVITGSAVAPARLRIYRQDWRTLLGSQDDIDWASPAAGIDPQPCCAESAAHLTRKPG